MKYRFEIEALVCGRATPKKRKTFYLSWRKSLKDWERSDYYLIERYLGKGKDVLGDASILNIKETGVCQD